MARLVTFGCSHTQGTGLKSSDHSWTKILADFLNRDLVNMGYQGNGMKAIAYSIDNFKFQDDDFVVVLWSHSHRHYLIRNNDKENVRIIPQVAHLSEYAGRWYKYYFHKQDSKFVDKVHIKYADTILKASSVEYIHCFCCEMPKPTPEIYLKELDIQANVFNLLFYDHLRHMPKSEDGEHLGVEANEYFAEALFKKIQNPVGTII